MLTNPQVGQRVICNSHWGKVIGTITYIFTKFPEDFYQHVNVRVDEVPDNWPYHTNEFSPSINELEEL